MSDPESNRRQLGLFSATNAVIATMIGAGIFGATGGFAHKLGTDTNVLLVWLFCGLLALTGALSLGELGGMMPKGGGSYTYNRHIYGPTAGYLSGVLSWLLAFVGAAAYVTLLLGHHVQLLAPSVPPPLTAALVVGVFSIIHCTGLRQGTWVNNAFTVFKVGVIVAFIAAGFSVPAKAVPVAVVSDPGILSAPFAAAMISVSFAYLGWETTTWIGGEVANPRRNLPLSLIVGTLFVTTLYLLLNMVYLRALPAAAMVGESGQGLQGIGQHAANILFSGNVSQWFNLLIIVVLLSTTSTIIMVGARILQAMAAEGQLPAWVRRRNRRDVPANAILIQAIALVTFIGAASTHQNTDKILLFIGLPTTFIMGGAVLGVLLLRRRERNRDRPFRVPLYPLPPLLFVALAAWMVISTIQYEWRASLGSAVLVVIVWALKPVLASRSQD
ncbi:MAG: amino acid permease [Verrucomicrobiota bacterium]|nr:amino acid permease [Verrucomicrobiota bacterium]